MPRYTTLAAINVEPAGVSGGPRTVPPGVEIDFDGPPNPTLFPLCAAARAAHAHVLAKRKPQQRVRHDIVMLRALRGLPKHLRRRCEQADAEAIHDSPAAEPAPVKPRRGRSEDIPATYAGAWRSQAGKPVGSALLKPR